MWGKNKRREGSSTLTWYLGWLISEVFLYQNCFTKLHLSEEKKVLLWDCVANRGKKRELKNNLFSMDLHYITWHYIRHQKGRLPPGIPNKCWVLFGFNFPDITSPQYFTSRVSSISSISKANLLKGSSCGFKATWLTNRTKDFEHTIPVGLFHNNAQVWSPVQKGI